MRIINKSEKIRDIITEKTVPPEGIALSVRDQYGYIVLKLD